VSSKFAWRVRPLHRHWRIILSHNLVTEIQKKLTRKEVGTNCFYLRYVVNNTHLALYSSGDAGAVTMSLCKFDFYMVISLQLVIATGRGNLPAVPVWTAETGRFGSKPGQIPDPLTLGRPNPDPYMSTCGFRRVWLDPLGRISGSAFQVSHVWLQ